MSSIFVAHLIITSIEVLGGILAILIGVLFERRLTRQDRVLTRQDGVLKEIHVLVNSRLDEALRTIALLKSTILEQASDAPLTPKAAAIVDEVQAEVEP